MKKIPAFKKIAFYGAIVIALIMIAKYTFYPPSDTASVANNNSSQSTTTTTPDTTTDIKILKSEVTDTTEQHILAEFYMGNDQKSGATYRLMNELNYSESHVERLRAAALNHLRSMLFG